MIHDLFDALVSLDASLAACSTPEAVLRAAGDHLPALLPCSPAMVAAIDDATMLPVAQFCRPPQAMAEAEALLADAVERGLFALALRRGQPVLDERADGRVLVIQALATSGHVAGIILGLAGETPDAERQAAVALLGGRLGSAHENLVLRALVEADKQELERRVAERTADLAAALDRAEAASRAKSAFLATMSHELRTPLNGIIGMADLLVSDEASRLSRDRLAVVRNCAEDLLSHIDSILDLSRIEAERLDIFPAEAEPVAVALQALRTVAPRAQGKGLALALVPAPDLPRRLTFDAARWRQVLLNLLGNAVKFTDRGDVVLELAWVDGTTLVAAVRDTGLGIPLAVQARLFTPFEQGDASINRRFGGTGLGLTISRRLCELMGGSLTFASSEGIGSTFTARIAGSAAVPRAATQPQPRAIRTLGLGPSLERGVLAALAAAGIEALPGPPWELAVIDAAAPEALRLVAEQPPELPLLLLSPLSGLDPGLAASLGGRRFAALAQPADPAEIAELAQRLAAGSSGGMRAAPAAADGADLPLRGMRVLIADDQEVNRLVLGGMLRRLGIEPVVADGGAQAILLAQTAAWDAVLLDCQMPEVDGFAAAAGIRAAGVAGRIVAVTAHAMAGDREQCLARGFDDYLAKPVRPDTLAATLVRCRASPSAPAPAATAAAPSRLAQLAEEIGAETVAAIAAAMLEEAPRLIAETAAALATADLATVAQRMHTLKGDAANIGLDEVSALAKELELAAKAGDAGTCHGRAGLLPAAWERAAGALRAVAG